jgi:hypothetical protein
MGNAPLIALGWLASLAGAFFVGREMAGGSAPSEIAMPEAGEPATAREREPGMGGGGSEAPRLVAAEGAGRPAPGRAPSSSGLVRPEVALVGPEVPLDLEGVTTADEFMKRFLAFAAAQLAGGPAEHKALYKKLAELMTKEGDLERFFGSDEAALPYAYPMMRFAMDRDAQVVDMMETLLKTGAQEPAFFQGEEKDDALEMFVEGLGPLLPGAVGPERLERFRGHAKAILAQDENQQPKVLRGIRSDLERVLAYWMPALSSPEALARIQEGGLKGRELLSLLRRLEPADRAKLDLPQLLGPYLEEGQTQVMFELGRLELQPSEIASLDERLFEGVVKRKVAEWQLNQWLQTTRRGGWPQARPFVEKGLRRGPPVSDAVALMLRQVQPAPPSSDVDDLLRGATVTERVAASVRSQFGLK